eukprot:6140961-Alexandrium_andersonii.AAC.1
MVGLSAMRLRGRGSRQLPQDLATPAALDNVPAARHLRRDRWGQRADEAPALVERPLAEHDDPLLG